MSLAERNPSRQVNWRLEVFALTKIVSAALAPAGLPPGGPGGLPEGSLGESRYGLISLPYRVAPSPALGTGIVRLGAARHLRGHEAFGGAEFRSHFNLGDDRLRQHASCTVCDGRARQRDVAEFFV